MITSFGRYVRKLRIDSGHLLKDLADYLDVSASYLSAVEMGKRRIPHDWVTKIIDFFELTQEQASELMDTIRETHQEIQIDLSRVSKQQRDLAFVFARKLDGLDESEIKDIFKVFKKFDKENADE